METSANATTAAAASTRHSFDSAYANLEMTVRNFSREKLKYEDRINGLSRKIESCEKTVEENNIIIQTLLTENQRWEQTHAEDETDRCCVEAMLSTAMMQQEVLLKNIGEAECVEREILERFECAADFIDTAKLRQVQLYSWINELRQTIQEQKQQIADLERREIEAVSNNERYGIEKENLTLTIAQLEANITSLILEKSNLIEELKLAKASREESDERYTQDIALKADALDQKLAEVASLTAEIDSLNAKQLELKQELVVTTSLHEKTLADITGKNTENQLLLESTIEKLKADIQSLEREQAAVTTQLDESRKTIKEAAVEKTNLDQTIGELETKMDALSLEKSSLSEELKMAKTSREQSDERYTQDIASKEDLLVQKSAEVASLTTEIESLNVKYLELKQELVDAASLHEKTLADLTAKNTEHQLLLESTIEKLKADMLSLESELSAVTVQLAETKEAMKEANSLASSELKEKSAELLNKSGIIESLLADIDLMKHQLSQTELEIKEKAALHDQTLQRLQSKYMSDTRQLVVRTEDLMMEMKRRTAEKESLGAELVKSKQKLVEVLKRAASTHNDNPVQEPELVLKASTKHPPTTPRRKGSDAGRFIFSSNRTGVEHTPKDDNTSMINQGDAKMVEQRQSQFNLPRRNTTAAALKGILRGKASGEKDLKNVSFNGTVNVVNYKSSTDSSDEDSEEENKTAKGQSDDPPSKKMKTSDSSPKERLIDLTGSQKDTDNVPSLTAPSPKKFFKSRTSTSPLKSYNAKTSKMAKDKF